jgi:hypothetical protein
MAETVIGYNSHQMATNPAKLINAIDALYILLSKYAIVNHAAAG